MTEALTPSVGWGVLHLFCKANRGSEAEGLVAAVKSSQAAGVQVVCFSVFGHKADLGVMALDADLVRLRKVQTDVQAAGLEVVDSYLSLTEVSEYARGMPAQHLEGRLHPHLPPEGKRAVCFYAMSKRRGEVNNWYALDYEERKRMMMEHGVSGRRFSGRVVQLITGSTGLDDYEWGVTLFGEHPDDLKETVYLMRYDEASARFAEFGPFYTGIVGTVEDVVDQVGLG